MICSIRELTSILAGVILFPDACMAELQVDCIEKNNRVNPVIVINTNSLGMSIGSIFSTVSVLSSKILIKIAQYLNQI